MNYGYFLNVRTCILCLLVSVLVIFQPELRRGLIRLGERPLWRALLTSHTSVVEEITDAVKAMSKNRIGALIALQRNDVFSILPNMKRKYTHIVKRRYRLYFSYFLLISINF